MSPRRSQDGVAELRVRWEILNSPPLRALAPPVTTKVKECVAFAMSVNSLFKAGPVAGWLWRYPRGDCLSASMRLVKFDAIVVEKTKEIVRTVNLTYLGS